MVYQLSLTIENIHKQGPGNKNIEAYKFVIQEKETEWATLDGYYKTRYTKVIS